MNKILAPLVVLGLLSGCVTPVQHNTPSGKAESCVHLPKDQVRSRIANWLIDSHFNLTQQSDYLVQGEKPMQGMASFLLASEYDVTPMARVTFNLLEGQKCIRVVADLAGITNAHSAFEKSTPFNNGPDSVNLQNFLNKLETQ
tara:strand:- start:419 stop:847 length:429 start_codon:yes stop_codon:yes gene_type:complete